MIQIALVGKISGADEVVVVPGNDKEWTLVRFGLDVERARGGAGKKRRQRCDFLLSRRSNQFAVSLMATLQPKALDQPTALPH